MQPSMKELYAQYCDSGQADFNICVIFISISQMAILPTPGPPSAHLMPPSVNLALWFCFWKEQEQGTVSGTFGMLNMGNGTERQVLRAGGPVGPGTFAN